MWIEPHAVAGHGGSVGCLSDRWSGGLGIDPHWVRQYSFVEIDHEIFSMVILYLQLIKEGQLSVSGEKICTSTGWQLRGLSAGLGGSVGCAVQLETRRSRVQPPPRSATFFRGDWSWNIFYGHSLPSADSRRAVVSFWRKNVHNTG